FVVGAGGAHRHPERGRPAPHGVHDGAHGGQGRRRALGPARDGDAAHDPAVQEGPFVGGEFVDVVEGVLEQSGDAAVVDGGEQHHAVGAGQVVQQADRRRPVPVAVTVEGEVEVLPAEHRGGGAADPALVGAPPGEPTGAGLVGQRTAEDGDVGGVGHGRSNRFGTGGSGRAEDLHGPVFQQAGGQGGGEHPSAAVAEGVGQEAGHGGGRVVGVAPGDRGTPDVQ